MGPRAISFRLVSATQASSASAACSYWHTGKDRLVMGSRDGAHGKLGMVGDMEWGGGGCPAGCMGTNALPGHAEARRRRGHWGGHRFLTPSSPPREAAAALPRPAAPAAGFGAQSITAAQALSAAGQPPSSTPSLPTGKGTALFYTIILPARSASWSQCSKPARAVIHSAPQPPVHAEQAFFERTVRLEQISVLLQQGMTFFQA